MATIACFATQSVRPLFRQALFSLALLCSLGVPAARAMEALGDDALAEQTGQGGLLVADKITDSTDGLTFYRMMVNAELGLNANIDKLQLGCGGFNDAVVSGACDIDIDYVTLMGAVDSGGQSGAEGSGDPATSQFKMVRPYLELAINNDGDSTRREIVGFKIGATQVDGYMGLGRYTAPGSAGASPDCTGATSGSGAYYCHQGINRLSGLLYTKLTGEAFGCFALSGCDPDPNINNQYRVATFAGAFYLWGTRMNRIQTAMTANTDPDATLGLSLSAPANVNVALRFIHGISLSKTDPEFNNDDFFISFQRQAIRYPTVNKSNAWSKYTNPGWWMNFPVAHLDGLKAYNVAASLGSLGGITLDDPDIGQRPPDNCYGSLVFC